ncbi:hypothetical protein ACFQKF_13855 [Halalkalicoccus sp. GCM10025322]|uniref:hypothetical protein n=1 Tax=Halalkalicoccus TaxID=332246 RepID=UPI002F96E857
MDNSSQQTDSDEVESSQHEKEGRNTTARSSLKRRSYLKLLGVSTLPLAARRVEAVETGYGHGGYGEGGYGGDGSDGDDPASLSVTTDAATNITASSATLNGTVTDLGSADAVDVYFEIREFESSTWSTTETQRLTATGSFSEPVEDLSSETRYEYRVLAESDGDSDTGETVDFTTEGGDEISEPVIETLEVSDTSPPNPHVDLEVSWSVLHEDDALEEVRIIIRNDNGRLIDGATISVGGGSASGLETFRITHGAGESYAVTLSVSDQVGNVTREDTTIST